jgi:hypothetical protein
MKLFRIAGALPVKRNRYASANKIFTSERDFGGPLRRLRLVNENEILWDDALRSYLNRHEMKYHGNLRLGPLLSAGARFVPVDLITLFNSAFASRRLTIKGMSITSRTFVTGDWLWAAAVRVVEMGWWKCGLAL